MVTLETSENWINLSKKLVKKIDLSKNSYSYSLTIKLVVFDGIIADIMTNRRFQAIIEQLFIRCRKLNISLVFITQSFFSAPKDVRLNSTHYLIMKMNSRKELQKNCDWSFSRHWSERFYENLQRMHKRTF